MHQDLREDVMANRAKQRDAAEPDEVALFEVNYFVEITAMRTGGRSVICVTFSFAEFPTMLLGMDT